MIYSVQDLSKIKENTIMFGLATSAKGLVNPALFIVDNQHSDKTHIFLSRCISNSYYAGNNRFPNFYVADFTAVKQFNYFDLSEYCCVTSQDLKFFKDNFKDELGYESMLYHCISQVAISTENPPYSAHKHSGFTFRYIPKDCKISRILNSLPSAAGETFLFLKKDNVAKNLKPFVKQIECLDHEFIVKSARPSGNIHTDVVLAMAGQMYSLITKAENRNPVNGGYLPIPEIKDETDYSVAKFKYGDYAKFAINNRLNTSRPESKAFIHGQLKRGTCADFIKTTDTTYTMYLNLRSVGNRGFDMKFIEKYVEFLNKALPAKLTIKEVESNKMSMFSERLIELPILVERKTDSTRRYDNYLILIALRYLYSPLYSPIPRFALEIFDHFKGELSEWQSLLLAHYSILGADEHYAYSNMPNINKTFVNSSDNCGDGLNKYMTASNSPKWDVIKELFLKKDFDKLFTIVKKL